MLWVTEVRALLSGARRRRVRGTEKRSSREKAEKRENAEKRERRVK
jgi:hypothetical protein